MNQTVEQLITAELVPLVRAALQTLADRVDTLTAELAEGELSELRRLVNRAARALEAAQVEGVA